MRTFNKKLNTDITRAKELHMLKDKTEFKKLRAVIMEEHKISRATFYREMNKSVPGHYATPAYSFGPAVISAQEKELVRSLLFKKVTTMQIRNELGKLTGRNYSWDRFNQIRLAVEEDMKQQNADSPAGNIPAADNAAAPEVHSLNGMSLQAGADTAASAKPKLPSESAFGDNLQILLEAVFHFEKMSEDTIIKLKYGDEIFCLGHDAVMDIKRIIMNSASVNGVDVGASMQMKIKHILTEKMRILQRASDCSIKDIAAIQRIYKSLDQMSNPLDDKELEWIYQIVLCFDENAERDVVQLRAIDLSTAIFDSGKYHLFDISKMDEVWRREMEEKGMF